MKNLLPMLQAESDSSLCVSDESPHRLRFSEGIYEPDAPRPVRVVCRRVQIDGLYKAAIRAYAENSVSLIKLP